MSQCLSFTSLHLVGSGLLRVGSPGSQEDTALNNKLWLPPEFLGLVFPRKQMMKRGVTILAGVIDPDQPEETMLFYAT